MTTLIFIVDLVISGNFITILYEAIVASIDVSNGVVEKGGHSLHTLGVSGHSIMFTCGKYYCITFYQILITCLYFLWCDPG